MISGYNNIKQWKAKYFLYLTNLVIAIHLLLYTVQLQHHEDSDIFSACWVILVFHQTLTQLDYWIFNTSM